MYVCTCTYISAWEGDHYLQAYRWKWFSRNPFGKTNSWTISPQKSFYGVREMEGEEWINRWSVSLCCTSVAPLQDKAGKRLWAFWVGMYAYMSSHVTDYWLQRFLFFDLLSICLLTFSKPFFVGGCRRSISWCSLWCQCCCNVVYIRMIMLKQMTRIVLVYVVLVSKNNFAICMCKHWELKLHYSKQR